MDTLNLPAYEAKINEADGKHQIFDDIRKKWVALTPEEWVRQHFIHYLTGEKGYPAGLMAVEMAMRYNRMTKRGDIVVHDREGKPVLIVECKAPDVKITQDAFDQVARYHMALRPNYVAVSNGIEHYYCWIDHKLKDYAFIDELPLYSEL